MNKKLLILGGSYNSLQILNTARKLGLEVGVADYYESSECKRWADRAYNVDIFDLDRLAEIVDTEQYSGVIAGYSDALLLPYYELCAKTGKACYGSRELFEVSKDKQRIKNLCKRYGVPVMKDYFLEHINEIKYPVVVKPVDSGGGKGVSICYNDKQLATAYSKAKDISATGRVIIEAYSRGKEITLFYYLHDGEAQLTAYGDRITSVPAGQKLPMPRGYLFPAAVERRVVDSFHNRFKLLLVNEGFREGMIYVQAFVENGKISLCELGYRLTPSFETFGIAAVSGFDPLVCMINYAVGNPIEIEVNQLRPYCGCFANLTLLLRPGEIASYEALDNIEQLEGVVKVLPAWERGHLVRESDVDTLAQVGLRVIISGTSSDDLIDKMQRISELASIRDVYGKEMILRDFDYNQLHKLDK